MSSMYMRWFMGVVIIMSFLVDNDVRVICSMSMSLET